MKQTLTLLALATLLLAELGCGTENPVEETTDTAEIIATGAFRGDVELIEGVTIYMHLLKAGQLFAQIEFAKGYVKQTSSGAGIDGAAGLFASTLGEVGTYHLKETEPGDYTLQISARGYQTKELNVTVVPDQSVTLEKVTLVALEIPVSHLSGVLTNETTGEVLSGVSLQLMDNAGKVYETLTTAAGVFTFENLPVQQAFTLTIAHAGYEDKEVTVQPIPAAETSELTVELTPLAEAEQLPPGQGLSIGSQAPEFELPDSNGKVHALADYAADKNVVLIFYRGGW